jgi:putative RNA 2'-phosphotransferase
MTRNGSEPSRRLSWLLRHGAGEVGIEMDAAGWAPIAEVLRALGMSRAAFDAAVERNDKARLEVRGARVRACQGHSLEGMPVTREALEASWAPFEGDAPVWHGTRVAAIAGIAAAGILPGARTHVHLAPAIDSVVGKRAAVDVMLEIAPDRLRARGFALFQSPNGVVLAREVPPGCIAGLTPMVERARRREADLRAALGLDRSP